MVRKINHRNLRGSEILYVASVLYFISGLFYVSVISTVAGGFAVIFLIITVVVSINNVINKRIPSNRLRTIPLTILSVIVCLVAINFDSNAREIYDNNQRAEQLKQILNN